MARSGSLLLALASAAIAVTAVTACSTADGRSPAAESTSSPRPTTSSAPPSSSLSPSLSPSPFASPSAGPSGATGESVPAFAADVGPVTPALARRMTASHRAGCPIGLEDLRHLRLSYVDFRGVARTGELVVHREVARDVVDVFSRLYAARWPVARMELVDVYGGDDDRSLAANNTSAYNCRPVKGTTSWSEHAYGRAIDLNPVQNPYVQSGSVAPPSGRRYAAIDRSPGADVPRGVIRAGDVVVRAFTDVGWGWGGFWSSAKDYQHFSQSGS